jgi:hypothetical protein
MEASGYISLTITGKTAEGLLNPKDIDISETKELLADMEILFFPTKAEREERPKVSYEVKEGSVKNIFYLPLANVIMLSALITEVGKQGSPELLEPKAAAIFDKWQQKAYSTGRQFALSSSVAEDKPLLKIDKETSFVAPHTDWVNTSLYLYGKIYEEGGLNKVNLHILTDRYGKLPVKASEEQLTTGENKLFKVYGLWVKGKQNIATGNLKDIELIDFLTYNPDYNDAALQKLIKKASANWKKIKDKDSWLTEIRGTANE